MKEWSDFQIGDLVEYEGTDFQIGDLVEYEGTNINPRENFIVGVVLGYKEFTEWDVHASGDMKTTSVVVYWNNGLETNTSPLVLRKL